MVFSSLFPQVTSKFIWVTDLHLDQCSDQNYLNLIHKIKEKRKPSLLITGDIAESNSIIPCLKRMQSDLKIPIHFVLGNHDFYGGDITEVRKKVSELCSVNDQLVYLTTCEKSVEISSESCLIGHDGWADGLSGDFFSSNVQMNDFIHIEDLKDLSDRDRYNKLNFLGNEAAIYLEQLLEAKLGFYKTVVLAIHVPPFIEACMYNGKIADSNWSCHMVCKSVGEMLLGVMKKYKQNNLIVLSGHTHHKADVSPLENLRVIIGGSESRRPTVQDFGADLNNKMQKSREKKLQESDV